MFNREETPNTPADRLRYDMLKLIESYAVTNISMHTVIGVLEIVKTDALEMLKQANSNLK